MALFDKLKVGNVLCETQYYKVEKIVDKKAQLVNDLEERIVVDEKYINTCLTSGDHFEVTKSITKTEMASLFIGHPGIIMTVNFQKQVDEKEAVKSIIEAKGKSDKELTKVIKEALKGEERTMRGRHKGEANDMGRISFIDMDKEKGTGPYDGRSRQVDPRTINWIVLNNTKYIIK